MSALELVEYTYHPKVFEALGDFGLRPTPTTPPALAKAFVNDLYRHELRALRDRYRAREIPRDRQGRISIPHELLQHIGLVNDEVKKTETRQSVVIAGVGWRLEIWAKDTWQQKEEGLPQDRIEALERLALGESSKAE